MHPATNPWVRSTAALAAIASCPGCIDTSSALQGSTAICLAPLPVLPRWESVVKVESNLRDAGSIVCTGIAIADTLVLTTAQCVALPSAIEPSDLDDPASRLIGGATLVYTGDVDYADSCRDGNGRWSPVEDGSFTARLGDVLEGSAITVSGQRGDMSVATSGVSRMVLPNADSRCWDTLAVLVLDHGLGLPSAVLKLQETSQVGDAVTMSGFYFMGTGPTRHEVQTSLLGITYEAGNSVAPPRSLVVAQPICDFETGGPIVNDQTGAVIGVIGFETDYSCEDPTAPTIAIRLAPFRRMLIDAAASASETLSVAPFTPPLDEPMPECSRPVE